MIRSDIFLKVLVQLLKTGKAIGLIRGVNFMTGTMYPDQLIIFFERRLEVKEGEPKLKSHPLSENTGDDSAWA